MNVPFADLSREYGEISTEIDNAVKKVLNSGWFILGKEVESFEKNFAKFVGTRFAVGCANGTDAITLALLAAGIENEDEVIVQTNTCVPTICGIINAGAVPVFCDVINGSLMADPEDIKKRHTNKTKVILPVNLFGSSANYGEILRISSEFNVKVIEDCAQSHGSLLNGEKTGTFGLEGCFSFYPSKNLGCYGDGGAVVTNDEAIHQKLLKLRNYGEEKRYYHTTFGLNSRLDELQAAILNVKLQHLDRWNKRRISIAKLYDEGFSNKDYITPLKYDTAVSPVYHLYVVKVDERDKLQKYLKSSNIGTLIHYPVPCHLQEAYKYLDYKLGDFPVAEENAGKILSLPIFPQMKDDEVSFVINSIIAFYES
jgi:dTDP-4-amino-4,6-dideoxygalactose transaminase